MDTMGSLLAVVVHAANIHDTKSGILVARDAFEKYPSIQRFCADAGYRKSFEQDVSRELGLGVDISARIKPEWEILPKRWIVERSLAWLNNSRRLSKDYERSVRSAQATCIIAAFAWPGRKSCVKGDKQQSREREQIEGQPVLGTGCLNLAYPPVFRDGRRYARAA